MRRRFIFLYLFLFVAVAACNRQPAAQPFSFIVVDDVHFARSADYAGRTDLDARDIRTIEQSQKNFLPLMRELKTQADTVTARVAAIFSDGDIVHGGTTDAAGQFSRFFAAFDSAGIPVPLYNTTGNHEVAEGVSVAYDAVFLPFMSKKAGREINNRHFSIDIGNSHFILLDGQPHDRRGGDHEERIFELMDAQWNWLASDLEANRDKSHIFVISHPNIWPVNGGDVWYVYDPLKQRRFVDLLLRYNVRAIFAGHEHMNSVVCYEDASGGQLVQMVPDTEIPLEAAVPSTPVTEYTVENAAGEGSPWSEGNQNLVRAYQDRIRYFRKTPGLAGYFVVTVEGQRVTVKFLTALGRGPGAKYIIDADRSGRTHFVGAQP